MGANDVNFIIRHLTYSALRGRSDRQLMEAITSRRDAAAFEALVERHGPMVFGVCRRILRHRQDAEDAFQTTFLVLARKAATLRRPESVASWLYSVASLTSRKARAASARRRAAEVAAALEPRPGPAEYDANLDEELNALPEKYRTPLILCALQGRSRREAATILGIAEGTLSSRIAAGREMLARRLGGHGREVCGGLPVAVALPDALGKAVARNAGLLLAGGEVAGTLSAELINLMNGVLRAMTIGRLKSLTAAVALLALLGGGLERVAHRALFAAPAGAAEDPPSTKDAVQRAALELQAAEDERSAAERLLETARFKAVRKQAEYRQLLVREAAARANRPEAKAESDARFRAIESHFKYRIPVQTGKSENHGGARIEILDVLGTQPEIKIGGYYVVHGRYSLPDCDRGTLFFHMSATDARFAFGNELDLQYMPVQRGDGEFTLLHAMVGAGYFHLQLLAENQGRTSTTADVYFGTGDTVYRGK